MITTLKGPPGIPDMDDLARVREGVRNGVGAARGVVKTAKAKPAANTVQAAAAEIAAESAPNMLDKAVGVTEKGLNLAMMGSFLGALPFMLLGGMTKSVGKLTSWATGDKGNGVGSHIQVFGKKIGTPARAMNMPFSKVGRRIERRTGIDINTYVGEAANRTASFFAEPVAWVAESTGFRQWRMEKNLGKANEWLSTATAAAKDFTLEGNSELLHKHLQTIAKVQNVQDVAQIDRERLAEALKHISSAVEKKGVKLTDQARKMVAAASKVAEHANAVHGYQNAQNVAESVANIPGKLAKRPMAHTVMDAAMIGTSVLGMYGVARGFTQQLTSLRHMYADMTGKDYHSVSNYQVLTGKVPAPVAQARAQLFKTFGFRSIMQTVSMGFAIAFTRGKAGWKTIAAQIGTQMAEEPLSQMLGESVLPVYSEVRKAHALGQQIPPEFYAEFIGAASLDLHKRGGAENAFTREVARQYAAENASPGEVLKEIASGKLMERVKKIAAANDAKAPQAVPQVSHVDRLNGKTEALQAAVGKHTADEQARRVAIEVSERRV